MKRKKAKRIRDIIEKEMAKVTDDTELSEVPTLLPSMKYDGSVIQANYPICWAGKVLRARVTLYDREEFNPVNSPDSWKEIKYKDGIRIIPDIFEPGEKFKKGEIGWYHDKLYKCMIDNTVWNPDEYGQAWEPVENK